MSVEFDEIAKAREKPTEESSNMVEFSDEEGYGKFLDLHECYEKYINLKGIEKVDYITYLGMFDQLYDIPKERKSGEYRKYLQCLIDYLYWFVQRIRPLMDLDVELQKEVDNVILNWESGNVLGWPVSKKNNNYVFDERKVLSTFFYKERKELSVCFLCRKKLALPWQT